MAHPHMSKYHLWVIAVYFVVCIYFFFDTPVFLTKYALHSGDFRVLIVATICALVSLLVAVRLLRFGRITLIKKNTKQFLLLILYALVLFALPEEIIFRGLIQTWLGSIVSNVWIAIVLSSIIYGLAHVLNGAKSFRPKEWNWKLAVITYVAGLSLGFSYFATDSLLVPTILHTLIIIGNQLCIKER